eukprot:CAMPEP_0194367570 /NCGR_PEP_ID=MMETSP0174-20130528/15680_1 /TAXON_ID=216777 /ORGANISM="Proboscia alata, Strain PI-D3" /LENGTH=215 /DNA_ID=CAMNT_0039143403 /DNA_START=437 /DNA_END=1080 /DNA_ORIENTATION=-
MMDAGQFDDAEDDAIAMVKTEQSSPSKAPAPATAAVSEPRVAQHSSPCKTQTPACVPLSVATKIPDDRSTAAIISASRSLKVSTSTSSPVSEQNSTSNDNGVPVVTPKEEELGASSQTNATPVVPAAPKFSLPDGKPPKEEDPRGGSRSVGSRSGGGGPPSPPRHVSPRRSPGRVGPVGSPPHGRGGPFMNRSGPPGGPHAPLNLPQRSMRVMHP